MSDAKARVVTEKNELIEKAQKLRLFINSDAYCKLDAYSQSLLNTQLSIMDSYIDILHERLKHWKEID